MEEITKTSDLFLKDSNGSLVLRDQVLKGRRLSNFDLAGELEMPLCIENCQFIDCSLENKTMALWRGVLLRNVTFQNFRFSGEAIIRPHMCSRENVKFIDQRRDMLLTVLPVEIPNWRQFHSAGWRKMENDASTLDISQFHGAVSIYGLNIEGIVIDKTRHVAFSVPENFNWRDVPIQSFDWKLALTQAMECIEFHLPPDGVIDYQDKSAPDLEVFMSDLSKLVQLGVVKR